MVDIEAPDPSPASSQRSSIELEDLPLLQATPEDPLYQNHPASWHPKVTGFRLFVTSVTLGLGIAKFITTSPSESTAAITIEWITGAAVVLFCSICGIFESKDNPNPKWFFVVDYMDFIWRFFRLCTLPTPRYRTDERDTNVLTKPKRPCVTGYRLLVAFAVIGFGLVKAYQGHVAAPTAIDWVYCITTTLSLYWLGLYEASSTEVLPSLFEVDYSRSADQGTWWLLAGIALHPLGIVLAFEFTTMWYRAIVALWTKADPENLPTSAFDWFFDRVLDTTCAVFAMILGIWGCVSLLASLCFLIGPPIKKIIGCIESLFDFTSWVLSCLPPLPDFFSNPTTRIRRVYTTLGMLVVAIGYVIVHGFALIVVFAWTRLCVNQLYGWWQFEEELPWVVWPIGFLWAIGPSVGAGIGIVGCTCILAAFFSPLTGSYMFRRR